MWWWSGAHSCNSILRREALVENKNCHNADNNADVIKWKHFPRYWPLVRGIHRSPVNSTHKGQWPGALMFSLICACINVWINNREAGDLTHLRRHRAHYDVRVMVKDRTRAQTEPQPLPINTHYPRETDHIIQPTAKNFSCFRLILHLENTETTPICFQIGSLKEFRWDDMFSFKKMSLKYSSSW